MAERNKCDNALYFEICILRTLVRMGYFDKAAFEAIVRIAAEDYGSNLVLSKEQICCN